jgi:hypothetical protein
MKVNYLLNVTEAREGLEPSGICIMPLPEPPPRPPQCL